MTIFSGAVGTGAKNPDAAKAALDFLQTPEAAALFKANGYELAPPPAKAS